ncbi:hypothetical protein Tsubulata_032494, partial [Turnera subulata]
CRHLCHHIQFGNLVRLALSIRSRSCLASPVTARKKGHSRATSEQLCKIVWIVEADLAAGELLYISGETLDLGCWNPKMAILMHPTESANFWKAECRIPSGVHLKYNYFVKPKASPPPDVIWRSGPKFSLLIPSSVRQNREVVVRDSWTKSNTERFPAHMWESWIEEAYQPLGNIGSPIIDDVKVNMEQLEIGVKDEQPPSCLKLKDTFFSNSEDAISIDQSGLSSSSSDRSQPIEEPWLLQSSIVFPLPSDVTMIEVTKNDDTAEHNVTEVDVDNQHVQVNERLLADGSIVPIGDDSVSTIILINSSVCTMQRIAILEDGKLVELLLEPLETGVQSDSVYLGVVTTLAPQMDGAFVDIGASKHCLLEKIKQNREPFIFPPSCKTEKKRKVNGMLQTLEEPDRENELSSHGIEVTNDVVDSGSQDDLVSVDHVENEIDDDFDVSHVKENGNGSVIDDGDVEVDFEKYLDGKEHHAGDKIISSSNPREKNLSSKGEFSGEEKWAQVRIGTKIVVQVVKEGIGKKGPRLTAYPKLRSRFWVLVTRHQEVTVSKEIPVNKRTILIRIAKAVQPSGFGLIATTLAAGHSIDELRKDLEGLVSTWKNIMERAKSAACVEGAVPVILHRAMGQTLSLVQDYFTAKVKKMVVDSPRIYNEVTKYLQDIAPDLCDRVELYHKSIPLFDEYNVEEEINRTLSKSVPLANGADLVIEQTEALVSIDVNGGGHVTSGHGTSPQKAILEVNLAAAKQIAREIRLRDIGGIIVVDFIDMDDDANKRLVYEEMKRAVSRDRSSVKVSELTKYGLMEMTRKRVRSSVTFMITEPCICCHATGRVEALETSFSKIEQEICRLLATLDQKADHETSKTWPKFILKVDQHMYNYMTSEKNNMLAILGSSLKVRILLQVGKNFTRGAFEVKPVRVEEANYGLIQIAVPVRRQTKTKTVNSGRKVKIVRVKKRKSAAR